ncbi:MAG: 16S rRNA (cytidine(1402)-2'-O)-methyltransferase [Candidatus Shapirobacteria bacterium]|nr:16S rRNA (cytidine(1402)-2'-O)-methyltransferase [Candidatus Shapirobacteria bacterium]
MLYLVATPIGNLKDISLRALEILEKVDFLLCEDTRNTGLLLANLNIKNKPRLISFYDEVEEQKIPEVIKLLENGGNVALVSDAGTPIISDPGFKLVKKCRSLGISYTAIPGACAAINALVLSGIPAGRFVFLGFLPKKDGERLKILEKYKQFEGSKIAYESPFRVKKLEEQIKTIYGDNVQISIIREMTKKFEEILPTINKEIKGEVVVVFN